MKVNFGKYIGKNIQVLLNDKKYCEWLLKQSFIKEKYNGVYNAIINYKPLRKINYNDLPDDIIEYINSFNAFDSTRGKYLPIYYPIKNYKVDNGNLVMSCKGEKWLTGWNAGKTFKEYSWGYNSCVNCGQAKGKNINSLCSFCYKNRWRNRTIKKPPLKLHNEYTCNNLRAFGMPVIENNKVVRVNEIPDFCLID